MVVVHSRAPTGRICIRYIIQKCALLGMQYVYRATRAKMGKTSSRLCPRDHSAVQELNRTTESCYARLGSPCKLRRLIGMENSKLMGVLIWRAVTTLPTPLAILLLLAMRFPLSLATTNRQNSTDIQVCVPRVRNSLIILYKIVQIY